MVFKGGDPENNNQGLRTFIAIAVDHHASCQFDKALHRLSINPQGTHTKQFRWIPAQNRHITLNFLGGVSQQLRDQIPQALTWLLETPGFQILFSQLDWFPNRHSKIVAALPGTNESVRQLLTLQQRLTASLQPLLEQHRLHLKSSPYRPHISLAKSIKHDSAVALPQKLPTCVIPVRSVGLFDSQLTQQGSLYSCLHQWPLLR